MESNKQKKILLTGGGSGGPVSPLLAVFDELKEEVDFLWIGTNNGPEKEMVGKVGIEFLTVANGKLRRYFSWQNFLDPFKIMLGFFQSIFIILKQKPNLVMSAGGFVSVPVVWAAWVLRVPVLIHQQDVRPGLANKVMAPFAKVITTTFEKSLQDYGKKAIWTGNPIRSSFKNNSEEYFKFLKKEKTILLVLGGGTGAVAINNFVQAGLKELTDIYQVVHVSGRGKDNKNIEEKDYFQYDFLPPEKMAEIMNLADIIVSRCGLATLTEISFLKKPAILIPIPNNQQEDNADIFAEKKAAIVLDQEKIKAEDFVNNIKKLASDEGMRKELSENMGGAMKEGANGRMVEVIKSKVV